MKTNTIKFKTSIIYSSILGLILIVYSIVLILGMRRELQNDIDKDLRIKAVGMTSIMNAYENANRDHLSPHDLIERFFHNAHSGKSKRQIINEIWQSQSNALNLKDDYINVLNSRNITILHSDNFEGKVKDLFSKYLSFSTEEEYFKTIRSRDYNLSVINYPFLFKDTVHLTIQIGTSRENIKGLLLKTSLFMALVIVIVLFVTSFMGRYLVKKILRPVVTVTNRADSISVRDLSQRIETDYVDEEMKPLINSFNNMLERLEGSFKHISDFSSHVAHEIKTPIAIIKGELELALRKDRDSEEYKRVMASLIEEVERIRKIIHGLLLLAKYDYNQTIFNFENVNIVKLLKDMSEEIQVLSVPKKQEVTFDYSMEDVYINGDKTHLRRLFLNLVNNAIKYTPPNGYFNIAVKTEGNNVHVSIKDNGEGISPEDMKKVFNKFYQVKSDEMSPEKGSGLGLSIAMSIARTHKGRIEVQSKLSQGSTFTVVLPIVKFFT